MNKRNLDLQWLMDNAETAKSVIAAALSDETAEDIQEFKAMLDEGTAETVDFYQKMMAIIKKGVDIALDIVAEPLQAAGIELDLGRGLSAETQKVKEQLENAKNAD